MAVVLEAPANVDAQPTPPLEAGDRLTHPEFMRRYNAMPNVHKAELIEGVVYMPSPVRHSSHGKPHANIITLLGLYCAATPGTEISDNATVLLDMDNDPQPDAILRLDERAGGASSVNADGYIEGPPELVVEIAASTESYDLHDKFRAYRRNGVKEYIVWRVRDRAIDWFTLEQGQYQRLPVDADGVVRSRVFPGLHLALAALPADDLAHAVATLQQGLDSPEHRAFVESLV
ncbi:MAG: Uma2 family endonuclease [Caldilineaceae bacterium]